MLQLKLIPDTKDFTVEMSKLNAINEHIYCTTWLDEGGEIMFKLSLALKHSFRNDASPV